MKTKPLLLILALVLLATPGFLYSQNKKADSLYKAVSLAKNDTSKVKLYVEIGKIQLKVGDMDKAMEAGENAKKLAQQLKFYYGLGSAYAICGKVYLKKADYKMALQAFLDGLAAREKHGNKRMIAASYGDIGNVYRRLGEADKALEYYNKEVVLSTTINDTIGKANALMGIGTVYYKRGDYPSALNYYLKSLKGYEDLGDKSRTATVLLNIGIIYELQNEFDKALGIYQRTLILREESNDIAEIPSTISCIANVYYGKKDYKKSLEYNLKARGLAEKANNVKLMADLDNNIGNIYGDTGETNKALEYFRGSYKKRLEIGDEFGIAESLHQIATMLFRQKKYDEAIPYSQEGIERARKLGDVELLKDAWQNLSSIYEVKKEGLKALQYYKEYIMIRDSLFNRENTRKTVEAHMNYEFDKKEAATKQEQEKKDLLVKQEGEKQKIIRNSFIGGFVLMLALAFFIFRGYKQKKRSNKEITQQKHIIEEKQKEIVDSINYALRIQQALMAHDELLNKGVGEHFVLFKPKDIVSGDFYWATLHNNKFYLAVCDSTGHGIPGAFMSLLNIGFLSEAINEKNIEKPNEVLNHVRKRLIENISTKGQKDGFDGILLCIDEKGKMTYAAAYNTPMLVENGVSKDLPADKMPVGISDRLDPFKLYTIEAAKGSMLYLSTDGYADQFGGPKGKKFKYKQLEELIGIVSDKSMVEQKEKLNSTFENWRGPLEQVDDVCIAGIKL